MMCLAIENLNAKGIKEALSMDETITTNDTIDQRIAVLQRHKNEWAQLSIDKKISLLETLKHNIDLYASDWAAAGIKAKNIAAETSGVGEEWISGPWATLSSVNQLLATLGAMAKGGQRKPDSVRTRQDGQLVAKIFPLSVFDRLLLNGVSGEVWMQPGVTEDNLSQFTAGFYQQESPEGVVSLVLGAGNISSIAPLDVLYKLMAEGRVCLLKMNPVNEYLGPIFEKIFEPFTQLGFVQFVYGGAHVGEYCTAHEGIDAIHITGSHLTHDAIVYGVGEEGKKRKLLNDPVLSKPISSELGGCCPTIIVPGPWSDEDIKYQSEHLVTQKYHNAGFNCVASQVLVMPEAWEQKQALLNCVEQTFAELPRRDAYYPGADKRQQRMADQHPESKILDDSGVSVPRTMVTGLDPDNSDEICFKEEAFGGFFAQTSLPGDDAYQFLCNAISFCNDKLAGTLGANIVIHPATIKELGDRLEQCIADLQYGGIGVNAWSALAYLLPSCSWGAFPGHTNDDIQSGVGVVHNTFLFDKPQKSVVYANFYPFPRALAHGQFHLSPRPPWFVTNKMAHRLGPRLTRFEANQSFKHIPGIFADALRG
jgi:aldehyde dehydrogenase (NAD(P)+)